MNNPTVSSIAINSTTPVAPVNTATMLVDVFFVKKFSKNMPEKLSINYPQIPELLEECNRSKSRFFGLVIVPGEEKHHHAGYARGLDSLNLLIHDLCDFSLQYSDLSQWLLVMDKKLKKDVMRRIDNIAKTKEKKDKSESIVKEAIEVKEGI